MSKKDGGHGFTRLSTKITEQKQQLMHTALEGNPATARAMKSILQRALNFNGCPPTYMQSATIHSIHDEGWISSLIQMHARLDQNIALGGTALANTVEQLILDQHNLGSLFDKDETKGIIEAGVITVGDLTTLDQDGRVKWTQTNRLPTPSLEKITSEYDPPHGPLTLRAGQCYLLAHNNCSPELGQVTEILGFTSTRRDEVYIRIWESKLGRPLAYKDTLTISPHTLSPGGGSNETRKVTELFNSDRVSIVTITKDIEGKGKKQPKLSRQYLSTREHLR